MKVIFEPLHKSFTLPKKGSEYAAGWDMVACIDSPIVLNVGERVAVPLGCRANIPVGYSIEILPRSGLAIKNGVTILNAPGLIDSDYRGEWHAIMVFNSTHVLSKNTDTAEWGSSAHSSALVPFTIVPGMKVCQIVLRKVEDLSVEFGNVNMDTDRGSGGFGSTGV